MRIRTALRAIREVDPALAHHLDRSITTGRFCVYRPEHSIKWQPITHAGRSADGVP